MNQPLTMNYQFDATQHKPDTGYEPVPAGEYLLQVVNTEIVAWSDGKGMAFRVTSEIKDGQYTGQQIRKDYGLWATGENSTQTISIAHGKLSSLCHVTGVMGLDFNNTGASLRGASYRATLSNDGKYNDIKVYKDLNGNKPGQAGSGFAQPQTAPVAVVAPQASPQGFTQQPQQFAAPSPSPQQAPQGWAQANQYPAAQPAQAPQQFAAPATGFAPPAAPTAPAAAPQGWAPQGGFAQPAGAPQQGPWGAPTA